VATINAALLAFALRRQAVDVVSAFDSVVMDYEGSADGWRHGGGRDLSNLEEDARTSNAA
jgi:hypothetical protein